MNHAFMVNDSILPSTHKQDCPCKKAHVPNTFEKMFSGFIGSEEAEISVKHIEVKGTMLSNEDLVLPNMDNLEELTDRMQYLMDLMFVRNDIPTDPPVEIEYSYTRTEVTVKGDRDDLEQISELINEDSELSELIQKTLAMASHVINMVDSLQFQEDYEDSPDPESVVDRYAWLFDNDRKMHQASINYGTDLSILSDGKAFAV